MVRAALLGALVFGLLGMGAGYVWTAYEFPFAVVVPAIVGWYVVIRPGFGARKAFRVGLIGGVVFTVAFMVALFLAITDGSPLPVAGWLGAVLASAIAGAVVGALLGGVRGAGAIAGFSAVGMVLAVLANALLRGVAPASIDVAGPAQAAYFATAQGIVAAFVGAAAGAGVAWLREHKA